MNSVPFGRLAHERFESSTRELPSPDSRSLTCPVTWPPRRLFRRLQWVPIAPRCCTPTKGTILADRSYRAYQPTVYRLNDEAYVQFRGSLGLRRSLEFDVLHQSRLRIRKARSNSVPVGQRDR